MTVAAAPTAPAAGFRLRREILDPAVPVVMPVCNARILGLNGVFTFSHRPGKRMVALQGRKIAWRDAHFALRVLLKFRFTD